MLKCGNVHCHKLRATGHDFCPECLLDFLDSPEAKQPNRGAADYIERLHKERAVVEALGRGNKPGDGPGGEKRAEAPRPTAGHLKMPVIAKPIVGPVVTVPVVVVVETEKERVERARREAARQWEAEPPKDLTEKENLK